MFVIKGEAEIKNVNMRAEVHGDEMVRAIDVKLALTDIDAKRLDSAVSGLRETFWKGGQPFLQEIYPLRVGHKIPNVECKISSGKKTVTLADADVLKVQITPKFNGRCEILLSVKASRIGDGILDPLHQWLRGLVKVEIVERQMSLPEMEQQQA